MADADPAMHACAQSGGRTTTSARPYRSKKRRPCDQCRRRRVGCFVEPEEADCTLCRHRGTKCTFSLGPPLKRSSLTVAQPRTPAPPSFASPRSEALGPTMGGGTPAARFDQDDAHSTVQRDRTSLYTGASSDQDVYLLRHLPFDDRDLYGHEDWTVWRALASEANPAYFTSYPNRLLDAHEDIYNLEKVRGLAAPHHEELINRYYSCFHPNLPVLDRMEVFTYHLAAGNIPASLLAAVYFAALDFWDEADLALVGDLRSIVFESVTREARTPSLRTVQAILIYLQVSPEHIREPNHPGYWPLTAQLVGIAQEIGLHVESRDWAIDSSECKLRRILWWSVYMQDKWLAQWYGRPSHIIDAQFDVEPLRCADFADSEGDIADAFEPSVKAFVAMARLTTVLSISLDRLYTVRNSPCVMSAEMALLHASHCQDHLNSWLAEVPHLLERPGPVINNYQAALAYYGIAVSIQRAVFACAGGTTHYDRGREVHLYCEIFDLLENLLQENLMGLWLSYCKANLAIIGSFIIVALLSSVDDEVYNARNRILERYCHYLDRLTTKYDFAGLPKLRFHLLLERLPQQRPVTVDEEMSTSSMTHLRGSTASDK